MMTSFIIYFALLFLQSGNISGDHFKTNKGDLIIHPVQHGTFVIYWNEKMIYVDPYGGAEAFANLPDPDLVLITDIHGDHHNQKTIDDLNTENAEFIVPEAVKKRMPQGYHSRIHVLGNGESAEIMEVGIEAVPMYNLPETSDSRHPKGRGNGYILNIGGIRIYISGDTEDIPEMRALENIDVAFVCMNLPYTMNVDQAASAVLDFKPKVVYPYHYRGGGGNLSDVEKFKSLVKEGDSTIEVRLKNWYPDS